MSSNPQVKDHLLAVIRANISISDRKLQKKVFKRCFFGSELVDIVIQLDIAKSREDAVRCAENMLREGTIRTVGGDYGFKDGQFCYRFAIDENEMQQSTDSPEKSSLLSKFLKKKDADNVSIGRPSLNINISEPTLQSPPTPTSVLCTPRDASRILKAQGRKTVDFTSMMSAANPNTLGQIVDTPPGTPPSLRTPSLPAMKREKKGSHTRVVQSPSLPGGIQEQLNLQVKSVDASNSEVTKMLTQRIMALEAENERLKAELALHKEVSTPTAASASKGGSKKKKNRKMTLNLTNVEVTERLAETGGSFASVFAAYVDGWGCAMKELRIDDLDMSGEEFKKEIQLLEQLPFHPNIVRYLFNHHVDNKLQLFMTRYWGTLGGFLKKRREGPTKKYFTARQITQYFQDITKGVMFLHSHNLIHRDLKSDNVFVVVDEGKDIKRLAIGDFDTSRRVSKKQVCQTVIGTPTHMSPEVMDSRKSGSGYTFKADVYSMGMILYELLTFKTPYEELGFLQVSQNILGGIPPAFPEEILSNTSLAPLIDLFHSLVKFDPDQRPELTEVTSILEGMR